MFMLILLAQLSIDKGNRAPRRCESPTFRARFHFDLEGITDETDAVQINGAQYLGAVAFESSSGIADSQPQNGVHVDGSEVAHEDAADGPVANLSAAGVTRTYGNIRSIDAGSAQAWKVLGLCEKSQSIS